MNQRDYGRQEPHSPELMERELATPGELRSRFPLSEDAMSTIKSSRMEVRDILGGVDSRLLVIVGPCSLDASIQPNGTPSVVQYANELKDFANDPTIADSLKVVMRSPVSKPRTSTGWAGLSQTDPETAFSLVTDLANLEVPIAIEIMSRDDADYYEDALTMGWVGARNVEDTMLRHLISDMPIPTLFKNSTTGNMLPAEHAIETAAASQQVRRMRANGRLVTKLSQGNTDTGIIFRGGNVTTPEQFAQQFVRLSGVEYPIIVDCSHGNSQAFGEGKKTAEAQIACVKALRELTQAGHVHPKGVMLESYLRSGSDTSGKTPGVSLTDPCIDIDRTFTELTKLAKMQGTMRAKRIGTIGLGPKPNRRSNSM